MRSFRNTGHVTDDEGHRAFALVNRATGKALGHCRRGDELVLPLSFPVPSANKKKRLDWTFPLHVTRPLVLTFCARQVHLIGHKPDSVAVSLLWTQSDDLGEEYHSVRTVNDVGLVLDAAISVPEAGGAHDGTAIIVFPWNGGCNQKWKMLPFY